MGSFEEDLELAKNISTVLKALVDGKLHNNLGCTISDFFNNSLLTLDTPMGHLKFSVHDEIFIGNAIWDDLIQIQLNSDYICLNGTTSIELMKNPEDEALYFQNSLMFDTRINSLVLIISYIIKHLSCTDLKSIVLFEHNIKALSRYLEYKLELL